MKGKHLTTEQRIEVRNLLTTNLNHNEIAKRLGVRSHQVSNLAKKMTGVKVNNVANVDVVDWKSKYFEAIAVLAKHGLVEFKFK